MRVQCHPIPFSTSRKPVAAKQTPLNALSYQRDMPLSDKPCGSAACAPWQPLPPGDTDRSNTSLRRRNDSLGQLQSPIIKFFSGPDLGTRLSVAGIFISSSSSIYNFTPQPLSRMQRIINKILFYFWIFEL